ncbi:MAG: ATP synthase F1 subunit epsilon [Nitrospirota bacterium]|nr:ATP synthase F1 subunit epsilon [Nitrospirota bacterium]
MANAEVQSPAAHAGKVRLEVVTPARAVLEVETDEVVELPGRDGMLGVLPGHASLMATLGPGAVSYLTAPDKDAGLVVSGGFVVIQDNVITVLAETAELPAEIDVARARAGIAAGSGRIAEATSPDEELAARDAVAMDEARVAAAARWA